MSSNVVCGWPKAKESGLYLGEVDADRELVWLERYDAADDRSAGVAVGLQVPHQRRGCFGGNRHEKPTRSLSKAKAQAAQPSGMGVGLSLCAGALCAGALCAGALCAGALCAGALCAGSLGRT
jgi:hypothetical protein